MALPPIGIQRSQSPPIADQMLQSFMIIESKPISIPAAPADPLATPPSGSSPDEKINWVAHLATSISQWLWVTPTERVASEVQLNSPIWDDWEWVMSNTEEFIRKNNEEKSKKIAEELSLIRNASNQLRIRPFFMKEASSLFSRALNSAADPSALTSSLDAAKRSKIISDIVKKVQDLWLITIVELFFANSENDSLLSHKREVFQNNFLEAAYAKNIVGAVKETAWKASLGPGANSGLDAFVLTDILWSMWKSLDCAIREHLQRNISAVESMRLAQMVLDTVAQEFVNLYITTVKTSRLGTSRAGVSVSQFIKAEQARKTQLATIKKQGADARYSYAPVVVAPLEHSKNLPAIKQYLASKLEFRRAAIKQTA